MKIEVRLGRVGSRCHGTARSTNPAPPHSLRPHPSGQPTSHPVHRGPARAGHKQAPAKLHSSRQTQKYHCRLRRHNYHSPTVLLSARRKRTLGLHTATSARRLGPTPAPVWLTDAALQGSEYDAGVAYRVNRATSLEASGGQTAGLSRDVWWQRFPQGPPNVTLITARVPVLG